MNIKYICLYLYIIHKYIYRKYLKHYVYTILSLYVYINISVHL